ncbi:hypothetical protein [Vulcanococcus sp.]|uniref:hypothetical protein n=1 Tax=Vulcanococcus sp. TaxID=2856995 RepID=UPI003C05DC66
MTTLALIEDRHAEMITGGGLPDFYYKPTISKSYSKSYTKFEQDNTSNVNTTYTPGWLSWSAFGNEVNVSQINAVNSGFGA